MHKVYIIFLYKMRIYKTKIICYNKARKKETDFRKTLRDLVGDRRGQPETEGKLNERGESKGLSSFLLDQQNLAKGNKSNAQLRF